jgi:outer membrane protein assembly factor BamB
MTTAQIAKPLRLWPGIAALVLLLAGFILPFISPDTVIYGMAGGVLGALVVIVWWTFFSRAPGFERWAAVPLMAAGLAVTWRLIDKSIAGAGMGMLYPIFAIPFMSLVFAIWAVATGRITSTGIRRATMVGAILLACVGLTLVRTEGITGDGVSRFAWRWTPTAEERLLAHANDVPTAPPAAPAAEKISAEPRVAPESNKTAAAAPVAAKAPHVSNEAAARPSVAEKTGADWPGFRGPNRNSAIPGMHIETDWSASPPVQMWRRPVGPGWSSFAVRGDRVYTQEQRGNEEVVTCYNLLTGEPVWKHGDAARFWESNAGAGPRGTPTLSNGRVYTFGATGILNALDARDGASVWSRDVSADAERKVPEWGFSSSPLVLEDLVIIAAAGQLVAYDVATGKPRWFGPKSGGGYSSPQLLNIDGVPQIVLISGARTTGVTPGDGKVLWEHAWLGAPMLQPALTGDGGVVIASGDMNGGMGTRRLAVAHGAAGWTAQEVWTSPGLKPYFNDFVVHKGHAYGFDGSILACIDLKDGKRNWKGGRYGHGQMVLLSDQDLLLVLSEDGELKLVAATPDQFTELARFPALEGKTWNHPVVAGDVLLVRNGEEMAAFRLPHRAGL